MPPSLTLPAALVTADATSSAGAIVTYSVSASENLTPSPTLSCVPPSGSTFPIGTTTVVCTAKDAAGNTASGSFRVLVQGAVGQITELMSAIQAVNFRQGITTSLDAKLSNALASLDAAKDGNVSSACGMLTAFMNETSAQSSHAISMDQANQLLSAASRIKAVIGCQ